MLVNVKKTLLLLALKKMIIEIFKLLFITFEHHTFFP